MPRFLLVIAFLTGFQLSYGHATGRADSLQAMLSVETDEGARLELLLELSALVFRDQTSEALNYDREAKQFAFLSTNYETERQKNPIKLLSEDKEMMQKQQSLINAEMKTQRWLLAAAGICIMLGALILGLLVMNNRRNRHVARTLKQKNKELELLNKEKDGLIGVVAHDIRSPLNRSTALTDLIEMSGPLNREQKEYLEMIRKVNEDGAALIQELLELNAIETGYRQPQLEAFELDSMIWDLVRSYTARTEQKALKLNFQSTLPPLMVVTDRSYLLRILDNLVSNAVKFTEPGKNIFLTLTERPNGIAISVRDEGQGIKPEEIGQLFQKFKKLSARPTAGESSTGLGLSIVKALIEALNGTIQVDSEPGVGTEFSLFFKLEKQHISQPKVTTAS